MLDDYLREEFTRNLLTKLAALVAYAGAARFKRPRRPPPLQRRQRCSACAGIVVKSHGSADAFAFGQALDARGTTRRATACSQRIAERMAQLPRSRSRDAPQRGR